MITRIHFNYSDLLAFIVFSILYIINIGFVYLYDLIPSYFLFILFSLVCLISSLFYNNKFYICLLVISNFLILSSLSTQTPEYGFFKVISGLLLPMSLVAILIPFKTSNSDVFLKSFVRLIIILNVVTFFIKLKSGFWIRNDNFGLFGPITFGWLNAYVFAIILNRNKVNYYLLLFSLLMIIWSGSKGPLLVILLMFLYKIKDLSKFNFKYLVLSTIFLCSITYVAIIYSINIRIINTLIDFSLNDNYIETVGFGSIGSRYGYLLNSLNIWKENFFLGVGFGNWQNLGFGHRYPHNILLELFSETGFLISFFLIVIFYLNKKNYYSFLFLTGLMCQFFSGDFSYFRYYLFFFLIGTFSPMNIKSSKFKKN